MLNVMVWGLNYSGACRILNVTETEKPKHDDKLIIGSYLDLEDGYTEQESFLQAAKVGSPEPELQTDSTPPLCAASG